MLTCYALWLGYREVSLTLIHVVHYGAITLNVSHLPKTNNNKDSYMFLFGDLGCLNYGLSVYMGYKETGLHVVLLVTWPLTCLVNRHQHNTHINWKRGDMVYWNFVLRSLFQYLRIYCQTKCWPMKNWDHTSHTLMKNKLSTGQEKNKSGNN